MQLENNRYQKRKVPGQDGITPEMPKYMAGKAFSKVFRENY